MELLKKLCANVATDKTWDDKVPPNNKNLCGRIRGTGVANLSLVAGKTKGDTGEGGVGRGGGEGYSGCIGRS